ncbi:MAG: adp-ribose pyrophosphatase [Trebouxia sp. A1-2]|nr:MAG: adp-ribose pyrophosphatase [Trebouxia sp. A1-2]
MPAGLIDEGEDAAQAAVRELKEETGYSGKVTSVSEPCFSDPGMTNSNMQWAVVDIDADAPENANVKPELEPGEFIDVFLVPLQGLHMALVVSYC